MCHVATLFTQRGRVHWFRQLPFCHLFNEGDDTSTRNLGPAAPVDSYRPHNVVPHIGQQIQRTYAEYTRHLCLVIAMKLNRYQR